MKQSIKIDIIYYGVERDTRLEYQFSDCHNIPIRALTSFVDEKNEFLYALKRGVYRSDIVIVVGGLFGGTYLPGVIAPAIGAPLEKIDYVSMGYKEPANPLMFPKGAIPLISTNGVIGGMLIESGRQAIVLVSEDETVRNDIFKSLIFPYIFSDEEENNNPDFENAVKTDVNSDADDLKLAEETEKETEIPSEEDEMFDVSDNEEEKEIIAEGFVITEDEIEPVTDDAKISETEEIEETEGNSAEEHFSSLPSDMDFFMETTFDNEYPSDDEENVVKGMGAARIFGFIIGILSIGIAAAIFVFYFMGLI